MEINEQIIESIVRKIIAEQGITDKEPDFVTGSHKGVKSMDARKVVCEKFPFESERVYLKDMLTIEESPRLGCGMMEMEDTQLPWTLKYDEVDYVVEGTLDILIDGKKISASAGEVIFIPKDSSIVFQAKGKTRFMYVVYPANWSEQ